VAFLGIALGLPVMALATAPATTVNVSVDSVYYSYLDKLSGMGYVQSLPNGARPYSRMQMAKWVVEAQRVAQERPMPAYLADELQALAVYLAPELATLDGRAEQDGLRLRSVTVSAAAYGGDGPEYRYGNGVRAKWQPFGAHQNGYRYGGDGNFATSVEVSGNIGHETAISLRPRFSYDKDHEFSATLEEGYIKTRSGIWAFEAGKEALVWGQGTTGTLALGDSTKPLTTVQAHFVEPQHVGGFFRFLREADVHFFYGRLEGNRAETAGNYSDFDHPGLFGARIDITPTKYFTFGLERISMIGGDHNGLDRSDWGHWFTGRNSYHDDKWDDIAGMDFRLRLPGVQFYGEVYGEDQAGGLPSDLAYRAGVYFPQLSRDGAWDMTMEVANTNDSWYRHSRYHNGWTYDETILGDTMGSDARKYYVGIKHHLAQESELGLYAMRTEMDRSTSNHPVVDEIGVTGQKRIHNNLYLDGVLGAAKVEHARYTDAADHDYFAMASLRWMY